MAEKRTISSIKARTIADHPAQYGHAIRICLPQPPNSEHGLTRRKGRAKQPHGFRQDPQRQISRLWAQTGWPICCWNWCPAMLPPSACCALNWQAAAMVAMSQRKSANGLPPSPSRSFVDWHKVRPLAGSRHAAQRIVKHVAPTAPAEAFDLLWRFLELAASVHERCDDSNGTIGHIFSEALDDLGAIAPRQSPMSASWPTGFMPRSSPMTTVSSTA
jgi:hypothetical protein